MNTELIELIERIAISLEKLATCVSSFSSIQADTTKQKKLKYVIVEASPFSWYTLKENREKTLIESGDALSGTILAFGLISENTLELLLSGQSAFYSIRSPLDSTFSRSLVLALINCTQEVKLNDWATEVISITADYPSGRVSLFAKERLIYYCYSSLFDIQTAIDQLSPLFTF